jgi:hypothetical protein
MHTYTLDESNGEGIGAWGGKERKKEGSDPSARLSPSLYFPFLPPCFLIEKIKKHFPAG